MMTFSMITLSEFHCTIFSSFDFDQKKLNWPILFVYSSSQFCNLICQNNNKFVTAYDTQMSKPIWQNNNKLVTTYGTQISTSFLNYSVKYSPNLQNAMKWYFMILAKLNTFAKSLFEKSLTCLAKFVRVAIA